MSTQKSEYAATLKQCRNKQEAIIQNAERALIEARSILTHIENLPADLKVGDRIRIKELRGTLGDLDAIKGKIVEVTQIEMTPTCMTGIRIHFVFNKKSHALDLGWFVETESEVAK